MYLYTKGYYSTIHQGLDRRALIVEAIWHSYLVPNAKVEPSISAISQVVDLHGRQKALWKAYQSTLASRGSEGSAMWRNGVWSWDSEFLCMVHSEIQRFAESWFPKISWFYVQHDYIIERQRVTSQVLWNHFWGKTVAIWAFYGNRTFSLLHVCCSACKCHYDSRREEGEYYERSKSTASRFWAMLGELLPIISIFWGGSQNPNVSQSQRRVNSTTFL